MVHSPLRQKGTQSKKGQRNLNFFAPENAVPNGRIV
jgi:hypothetical protein